MRYTIARLNREFPNEDACLKFLFEAKKLRACPRCGTEPRFYKLNGRKCYSCMHCALHIYPTAGTIFHKSETPLKSWFFAIFLFGNSKNGVSAKELERHLGVTYKCAWRMKRLILDVYAKGTVQLENEEQTTGQLHSGAAAPQVQTRAVRHSSVHLLAKNEAKVLG